MQNRIFRYKDIKMEMELDLRFHIVMFLQLRTTLNIL